MGSKAEIGEASAAFRQVVMRRLTHAQKDVEKRAKGKRVMDTEEGFIMMRGLPEGQSVDEMAEAPPSSEGAEAQASTGDKRPHEGADGEEEEEEEKPLTVEEQYEQVMEGLQQLAVQWWQGFHAISVMKWAPARPLFDHRMPLLYLAGSYQTWMEKEATRYLGSFNE
eukprot:gene4064-5038_t